MSRLAHYSAPALSGAASGKRLPSWDCVAAYINACGVSRAEIEQWREKWNAAKNAHKAVANAAKALNTPEAADGDLEPTITRSSTADGAASRPVLRAHPKVNDAVEVPNPEVVATWNDLALGLDAVRCAADLSYRRVASNARHLAPGADAEAPRTLGVSSISEVLNGRRRPSVKWMLVYLAACGIGDEDLRRWSDAYRRLKREEDIVRRAQKALHAVKADQPDGDPTDTGQHNNLVNQLLEEMARRDPKRQAALEAMARSKVRVTNAPAARHRRPPTVQARATTLAMVVATVLTLLFTIVVAVLDAQ